MLDLAVGGYTAAEVEYRLRNPGSLKRRFSLLDPEGDEVLSPAEFPPVTEASVTFDYDREVRGSLDLTMTRPEDTELARDLRRYSFRWRVKAEIGIGPMPDGQTCWIPVGIYVWQKPKVILGVSEKWTVELGDQGHIMDAGGPGLTPVIHWEGTFAHDAIKNILRRAGFSDVSGVAPSDIRLGQGLAHTFTVPAGRLVKRVVKWEDKVRLFWEWLEDDAQTWAKIAAIYHDGLGYQPGWFGLDGKYHARPAIDFSTTGTVFAFEPGDQSIMVLPVDLSADLTNVGNRVFATLDSTYHAPQAPGVADLNALLPNHPLAERFTRIYIDFEFQVPGTPNAPPLAPTARTHLFDRLSYYEHAEIASPPFPFFEPDDPVSVFLDDDLEFDTPELFAWRGMTLDLFRGRQSNDVRRFFREA